MPKSDQAGADEASLAACEKWRLSEGRTIVDARARITDNDIAAN
jgi:hypothetical protein